ncbi:MAG: RNA ligase family protein [Candidatus Helarchaeota archaeon]
MNLVTNSSEKYQLSPIEGEILSVNGRTRILDIEIPPYPKLLHLSTLNQEMLAQKKVNGYNVRLAFSPNLNHFIAILRGGYVCAKTTIMLRRKFASPFLTFFQDHPHKVLVMEVLGRKSLANLHVDFYKEKYRIEDIGYFVFDIMDLERAEKDRFLSYEDVKHLCNSYNLQLIPTIGIISNLAELIQRLQDISPVFEGAVVKSLDGKERWKYRFDQNPALFAEKLPKKPKKESSPAAIIVQHFFQGYGEPQLGLASGISPSELTEYHRQLDEATAIIANDFSKIGMQSNHLTTFLMDLLKKHGTFDKDRLHAIEKLIKKRVANLISKILRKIKAHPQ